MSFLKDLYRASIGKKSEATHFTEEKDSTVEFEFKNPTTAFEKTVNCIVFRLQQAEIHGDFTGTHGNVFEQKPARQCVEDLIQSAKEIAQGLKTLTSKETAERYLQDNEPTIKKLVRALESIDQKKIPGLSTYLWELADLVIGAFAVFGLGATVVKLAGAGFLGGAFAHLIAPASAPKLIEGVSSAMGFFGTLGFKRLWSSELQLRASLQEDVASTIKKFA